MKTITKERLFFVLLSALLLAVEIFIGTRVRDAFVRPYLGDTLVVILIWAIIRIIAPRKAVWLSGAVFVFALAVETTQLIPLVDLLGIENRLIRVLMGNSFAFGDLIAYAAGCAVTFCADFAEYRKRKNREKAS